jgi:hypothetical protein
MNNLRAIQTQTDMEDVLRKEVRPLTVDKSSVRLNKVLKVSRRGALTPHRGFEKGNAGKKRLSAVPQEFNSVCDL